MAGGWGRGKRARPGGDGQGPSDARRPAEEPSAYQRALGLLVRREHSRKELTRKLVDRGLEREEIEPALEKLARQDFQNDERFASALARSRASAGYGPARIRAELSTHGLAREDIVEALDSCERDWDEAALEIANRRFASKDLGQASVRRKALDFLLRRGFDQRGAQAALGQVVRERQEGQAAEAAAAAVDRPGQPSDGD